MHEDAFNNYIDINSEKWTNKTRMTRKYIIPKNAPSSYITKAKVPEDDGEGKWATGKAMEKGLFFGNTKPDNWSSIPSVV